MSSPNIFFRHFKFYGAALLVSSAILCASSSLEANEDKVKPFLVGPEDVLSITVWKDPELTKEVVVEPDGNITVPLIGQVMAKGKTIKEIQTEVTNRLDEYIPSVNVSVGLTKLMSYKIYVIGKVNKPGVYLSGRTIAVLQALSMAGGTTPFAVKDKIFVIRKKEGKNIKIPFNYIDIIKGRNFEQNIDLVSGDVIVVP